MAAAEPVSMRQVARICLRRPPSRTQPVEYRQRRLFRARRQISRGTDTRWASLLAAARCDEFARLVHQQFMRAEQRFGEADAARIGTEEVQIRVEEFLRVRAGHFFHARGRKVFGPGSVWPPLATR